MALSKKDKQEIAGMITRAVMITTSLYVFKKHFFRRLFQSNMVVDRNTAILLYITIHFIQLMTRILTSHH